MGMTAVFVRLTVQKLLMKHKTSHVEPRADMV